MSAKAKKTELVATDTKAYKVRRMKEVRALVAAAVKHGQRVDLMDFEGDDIPRAMIALQDMLTDTQERHKRATGHVCNLVHELSDMSYLTGLVIEGSGLSMKTMADSMTDLSIALQQEREARAISEHERQMTMNQLMDTEDRLTAMKMTMKELNS